MVHEVIMYTDGAARGNPGPGGYGTILIYGKHKKELSAGYKFTTNNRMELRAVVEGLNALKINNCRVTVFSDSRYVVDSVQKGWVFQWEKKDFKDKKNPDLWKKFLQLYRKHQVVLKWVKGHANNPYNERCDKMAVKASNGTDLYDDDGYGDIDYRLP